LKQALGYDNVYRLSDGIISYENWFLHEQRKGAVQSSTNDTTTPVSGPEIVHSSTIEDVKMRSRFQGKNYIFDARREVPNDNNINGWG